MKKLSLVVLAGVFCLSVTNVFAQTNTQTRPETDQEKIIRLETENAALRSQLMSLTTSVGTNTTIQPGHVYQAATKPYYSNMQVQQTCEEFDAIDGFGRNGKDKIEEYAKEQYARKGRKIVSAELKIYSLEQYGYLSGTWRVYYKITLLVSNPSNNTAYYKTFKKWIPENLRKK